MLVKTRAIFASAEARTVRRGVWARTIACRQKICIQESSEARPCSRTCISAPSDSRPRRLVHVKYSRPMFSRLEQKKVSATPRRSQSQEVDASHDIDCADLIRRPTHSLSSNAKFCFVSFFLRTSPARSKRSDETPQRSECLGYQTDRPH